MTSVTVTAPDGGAAPTTLQTGSTLKLAAQADYGDGNPIPVQAEWASKDEDTATVDETGTVTGVKAGTARITATVAGVTSPDLTITVTDPPLATLTLTATARAGGQTLAVKEPVTAGCQRRYRITDTAKKPTVAYGTVCDQKSGWQEWPADGQVSGVQGQTATVVDCLSSGANARAKGEATLPAPGAAA